MKLQTEVAIESVKIGRASRSNGSSGALRLRSWCVSEPAEQDPEADLCQCEGRGRMMRQRLQAAQREPEGSGVQECAHVIQWPVRALRLRQRPQRDQERHQADRHVDAEEPAPVRHGQDGGGNGGAERCGDGDCEGVDARWPVPGSAVDR